MAQYWLLLLLICCVAHAIDDDLFRQRPRFPMNLKAYSTTDLPKTTVPLTPGTQELEDIEKEKQKTIWTQILGLYYSNNFQEAINKLETLRVKRSEYFHTHGTVTELPFYYNHALLHIALYRRTRRPSHLINARMDLDIAIARCRHFYPAYIARTQILVYERNWPEARRQLNQLVELLSIQRFADINILKFDANVYKGTIFVADILVDLGAIEYRMGVIPETCESRFTVASQILGRCEREVPPHSTSTIQKFFQEKRSNYQQIRSSQLHSIEQPKVGTANQMISFSLELILLPDTNDVGLVEWQSITDHLTFRALEGRRHKRLSSGPSGAVIDNFHRHRAMYRVAKQGRSDQVPLSPLAPPAVSQFIPPVTNVDQDQNSHRWAKSAKNRFKSMLFKKNQA